jgi:DNA repair protein RadA/Sms
MAKQKTIFICSECGNNQPRWIGCCPECQSWNSYVEETIQPLGTIQTNAAPQKTTKLLRFNEIVSDSKKRLTSNIHEWDRVMGGGILPGSFVILTGDPGIGKSTLLLQVADKLAVEHMVLYFSSEESLEQVKSRTERLGLSNTKLLFSDEPCLEAIIDMTLAQKPDLIILDSIQNCHFSSQPKTMPGTIAQLREAAFYLMRLAKENNIAVLVTGHITKDGQMAGPKLLEHMVDAVFYLQGEDRWHMRILRSVKNRFGTINEIGFFEMQEQGLIEIANLNQQLLKDSSSTPGATLVCCLEGSRPILLELQSLCVESRFGIPQRVVTGIDQKRVILIAAILEKYLHIKFSSYDIFFKVSGGVKIQESSADLGIALSLLSNYFQKPLPEKTLAIGEVSLTGLISISNQMGTRIKEAEKFGITKILTTKDQKNLGNTTKIIGFKNVYELLGLFPEE